jgi:hypothetical protein
MCFSASASFTAAGISAAAGIVAISRHARSGDILLAAMPIVFSVQQVIEGVLWLELASLPEGSSTQSVLGVIFLAIAQAWWPVYAPLAAILAEGKRPHRFLMFAALFFGLAVSIHFLVEIASQPVSVSVAGSHLVYTQHEPAYIYFATVYLGVTAIPFLVSSHGTLRLFGLFVAGGAVLSATAHSEAFVSVWCFLAAVASCVIAWHFLRASTARGIA